MKKILSLSFILIFSLKATEIYDISELSKKALENAMDLQISSLKHQASQSRYKQAFADYLPKIDLDIVTTMEETSIGFNKEMVSNKSSSAKLSAQQLLYDFGKTAGNSDSLNFDAQAYSNEYSQKKSDKIRDVKNSYYKVLQAISLIDVQKKNVTLNEIQLYRAKKYFLAGIKTKIDVSDAKLSLLQAQLKLKNAHYDLKLSYASLDEVVGLKEIKTNYQVHSTKLEFHTLYSSLIPYTLSLKESIHYAYQNKNEIKQQKSYIKSAQAKTTYAQSQYYPSIYLNGAYTKQTSDTSNNALAKEQWKLSANLHLNIYKGGATDAATQEKKIDLQKAQTNLIYSKLLIKTQTTQAFINVNKTKDSVELSQNILKVSNEKFNQAGKRYENGLSDFIELQQARQTYIDAMTSLVLEHYNYYIAIAMLDNAIGK